MKFRLLSLLLAIAFSCLIKAQTIEPLYTNAYSVLDSMLIGTQPLNFQKAVFTTENAYLENRLNEEVFSDVIHDYTSFCRGLIASGGIIYPEKDTLRAAAQCAVFMFMTDSVPMATKEGTVIHYTTP
jgi:hypothetical protein